LRTRARASAPGKIILLGEHFVVHGEPAIVLAIDKRAVVTAQLRDDRRIWVWSETLKASGYFVNDRFHTQKGEESTEERFEPVYAVAKSVLGISGRDCGVDVEINSSIPISAGLGSSAAVAVASAAALNELLGAGLSKDGVFQLAFDAEKIVHGTPSGIDPAISTYGGVLLYRSGKNVKPLNIQVDLPLVIGDTMQERPTGKMVAHVNGLRRRYPLVISNMMRAGGKIALHSIEALQTGDLEILGELMNMNHALLCAVGVSNERLEKLVRAAREAGALGAKLTGAGGGGCMIALAFPEKLDDVADAIRRAGGEAFITRKTAEGVRIEE